MTVAELRERLDACNPDDIVVMHVAANSRGNCPILEDVSSCDIEEVTFLHGEKVT